MLLMRSKGKFRDKIGSTGYVEYHFSNKNNILQNLAWKNSNVGLVVVTDRIRSMGWREQIPPPPKYGQLAAGTHHTGMHSCLFCGCNQFLMICIFQNRNISICTSNNLELHTSSFKVQQLYIFRIKSVQNSKTLQ